MSDNIKQHRNLRNPCGFNLTFNTQQTSFSFGSQRWFSLKNISSVFLVSLLSVNESVRFVLLCLQLFTLVFHDPVVGSSCHAAGGGVVCFQTLLTSALAALLCIQHKPPAGRGSLLFWAEISGTFNRINAADEEWIWQDAYFNLQSGWKCVSDMFMVLVVLLMCWVYSQIVCFPYASQSFFNNRLFCFNFLLNCCMFNNKQKKTNLLFWGRF